MSSGIEIMVCIIALTLIMIAEKGLPVKLSMWDIIIYCFLAAFLLRVVNIK